MWSAQSKGMLKMWIEQALASVMSGKADSDVGGSLHEGCEWFNGRIGTGSCRRLKVSKTDVYVQWRVNLKVAWCMGRELKLIQVCHCQKFLITSPLVI